MVSRSTRCSSRSASGVSSLGESGVGQEGQREPSEHAEVRHAGAELREDALPGARGIQLQEAPEREQSHRVRRSGIVVQIAEHRPHAERPDADPVRVEQACAQRHRQLRKHTRHHGQRARGIRRRVAVTLPGHLEDGRHAHGLARPRLVRERRSQARRAGVHDRESPLAHRGPRPLQLVAEEGEGLEVVLRDRCVAGEPLLHRPDDGGAVRRANEPELVTVGSLLQRIARRAAHHLEGRLLAPQEAQRPGAPAPALFITVAEERGRLVERAPGLLGRRRVDDEIEGVRGRLQVLVPARGPAAEAGGADVEPVAARAVETLPLVQLEGHHVRRRVEHGHLAHAPQAVVLVLEEIGERIDAVVRVEDVGVELEAAAPIVAPPVELVGAREAAREGELDADDLALGEPVLPLREADLEADTGRVGLLLLRHVPPPECLTSTGAQRRTVGASERDVT